MLAIFKKGLADPPQELNCPTNLPHSSSTYNINKPKLAQEILNDFMSSNPNANNTYSISLANNASLAFAPSQRQYSVHRRLFCGVDGIYCIFLGSLNNLSSLNKQYGLSKGVDEAMFVIEAYRTLRDRGPYPAHQVLKELDGTYGFVVYDTKDGTVFVALGAEEGVKLYWGIGADESVIISDNLKIMKSSCAKSFAPFPNGCMYHNEKGLMSFEYPRNNMKAMPRIDSEGTMCGANFKVDYSSLINNNINTMPRVGSEANWATWGPI